LLLFPVAGVENIFRLNDKLSGQRLCQRLYPFYLAVCWPDGFVIGYNAYADGLTAAVPGLSWYDRPLSLPFFGWLYLAIIGTEAVTDNEVAVEVLRTGQAAERSKLFDVSGFGGTIVDFDTVPAIMRLGSLGRDSFFDRVETIIIRQAKWAGGGRIVAQGH